jgi:NAD(P)-dependent dehydrogenase (short-subunit alcohol dehydrogenase family)
MRAAKSGLSSMLFGDGRRVFEGKTALIVGASRGIGAATARAFAGSGARLILGSRNLAALESIANELRSAGGIAEAKAADVNDENSLARLVEFAVKAFGSLDVAVNNAGMALPHMLIGETATADFDRLMQLNARGVFVAMKYEINAMLANGGGAIVNVSSVGGLIGSAGRSCYVASKHALGGLTKSAALEYANDNIRVNAVAPGVTLTELIRPGLGANPELYQKLIAAVPMGRAADPMEIANAIAWLASDLASFVTGVVMPVDGGFTVP